MILLDSSSALEMVLGGAVTTNELQFYSAYVDIKGDTAALTPQAPNTGESNGTTDVEIVASPDTGFIRQVKQISIYNSDTVDADVTVKLDDSSAETFLITITIPSGKTLVYNGTSWDLSDSVFGALAYLNTVDTGQIDDEAVTVAKMSASQTDVLFGRDSAGAGEGEEISIGTASGAIPRIYEDDFTAVLSDASTGGNDSPTSADYAHYVRVGNQVTISGLFSDIDTTGMTGANLVFLTGLPFPADSGGAFVGVTLTDVSPPGTVISRLEGGNSYLNFYDSDDVSTGGIIVSDLTSGQSDLYFTLTYFTDA